MAYRVAIFDVDGVLVDSPHELAWRESLRMLMEGEWRDLRHQTGWAPGRFTPTVYQQTMAGRPRMAGARAAMEYFGVPGIDARAERYAAAKQEQILRLIEEGRFVAFPDALRFILAVKDAGIQVAAASSSKNAKLFLERIRLDTFAAEQRLDYGFIRPGMTLEELFDVDISGRDFPRGSPTRRSSSPTPPSSASTRPTASWSRTPAAASRQPRLATWRRWGWPAWTTGTCWSRPAPTWSCPPSTTSPCRLWPRVAWRSGGRPPRFASGIPNSHRACRLTRSLLPG
jgi:haloacid dehalogenase-like hydrolase